LPKFKPASVPEIQRRTRAADFDPQARFFAEESGRVVGYATFHTNGRVSFPWCLKGFEHLAEPLFQRVVETTRQRGLRPAFAAYRGDWPHVGEFFVRNGFRQAREMINYIIDLVDLPTAPARPGNPITPLQRADVPAIFNMMPEALRVGIPAELERHFFDNPY